MKARRAFAIAGVSLLLAACAHLPETPRAGESPVATTQESPSEFVGAYNGNSFETAMGMLVEADGTFRWGLSVGGLDMRASGTWEERDGTLLLTSTPTPVAPEFAWSGLEQTPDGPLVRIVRASDGEPFQYASATLECSDGKRVGDQVMNEGWSPDPGACPDPVAVRLRLSMYDIVSERYDLAALGWSPGMTARFEFRRNDLGVADFTGATGRLEDGMLKLEGARWPLEMRKMPPREAQP
ncbi:hypothetical protein [Parerythrobacter jejuensis]|uniref:Lipoprotein n=1 Tax=Parerythrobacter jejuensis TaxID=795812 RepID=A0A845AWE9_9SPHN|nr:hypothetical protein [Parerythrobacter jejuensis]MXP31118.1 hypothetical protein [Parerythrobacter jejuensis]MXP33878.1 hypothetical protein [Parerythrobacter jejuensis]